MNKTDYSTILASPTYRTSTLSWLDRLYDSESGSYALFAGGIRHLLPSCFAIFLRELFDDLPVAGSKQEEKIVNFILQSRDSKSGLFDRNIDLNDLSASHDIEYLKLQQTHFSLQALRIMQKSADVALPFLSQWDTVEKIRHYFDELNWRNPWKVSNNVMFVMCFLEHEYARSKNKTWLDLYAAARDWLVDNQRESGLWGEDAEKSVYNSMYGAYHFLFFFLYDSTDFPKAEQLLKWLRPLQTNEGYFAHNRGGGACEDYDCVDLLIKLGNSEDQNALLKTTARLLNDQNSDGAYCWAKKDNNVLRFLFANWKFQLSLKENLRLFVKRTLDVLGSHNTWRYSGLKSLECPTGSSDIWSTWFRNLILAEIDDKFINSGRNWKFRRFPSLGWHKSFTQI
jgi:hypothetical protein